MIKDATAKLIFNLLIVSEITDLKHPLYKLHPKLKKKLVEGNLKRLIKDRKE